jgi:membrane protein implicated in regulation of membrane protease activity
MDFGSPRMLVLFTLVTALVVGAIAALAIGEWWVILIPLVLHGVGTTIVVSGVFKRVEQGDKPDPVTEARLEEEGKL